MKKEIYILLFFVALFGSCQRGNNANVGKRVITVTIEPLRYFTEYIAGDKFEVETMVPDGANPETYEPSVKQMISLSHSDLYIKVGAIGFERTWMKRLKDSAPHISVVDSSDGIEFIKDANGIIDPHVWMSPANAIVMAKNIYRALADVDSKDSLYFKKNLERFCSNMSVVDQEIRNLINKNKTTTFMIYHPILTYFAKDYGLVQIPLEEEGREPSARQLKDIISRADVSKVKVLLVQKEFSGRSTELVANSTRVRKVLINPLGYDWQNEIINIARNLK